MKTTAVLLAAVTLSCAAGVGASPALGAETPTPTTQSSAPSAAPTGGLTARTASLPRTANPEGTPTVPPVVPDAPARVRAVVGRFALSAPTWTTGTAAPKIAIRIDAPQVTAARVQVRVEDRATSRVVLRQSFGVVRSGAEVSQQVTPRLAGKPGSYRLRVLVRDQTGRKSSATARTLKVEAPAAPRPAAPAPVPQGAGGYVFPVLGACNFRSSHGQRFHAGRGGGRAHNGHDIGTFDGFPPVVAVTSGTVSRVWFDGSGGGWTIVFDGDDGTAYGYLHLKTGSILVQPGERVAAGQTVANAGNTGGDYEPHLHFEMRPIPWDAHRDDAVDPLPLLSRLPNGCTG
ncbi:M23 family metallopeptidase [Patulibacter americanus]|uniref:M23 family metallopeptidase n=1 Tax=Patulibacter americanus TaxID=588672 RepID=UPI00042A3CB8|nr:M23 family metallopeptidase [Patulibacter americanus]